jgi:hypothetical protein
MCASTANRTSPSSQDCPQSLPFSSGVLASLASYKNPSRVSLPWCSAPHEVARGDSSLFRISPGLPRSASRAAACGRRLRPCRRDSSVFSSTANCRLSASAPPTFVPRIGRSPVRRFFSILSPVSCKLSPARPERSRRVNCFALFALCHLLCFHTNTTIKFRNPFVLITMQIAGGWGHPWKVWE